MAALSIGGSPGSVPTQFADLLKVLQDRPQPAVVFYGEDDSRVELSGRVLANWAVKLASLFTEEYELGAGEIVVVDAAPHWKAAAVVLAAGALGAEVVLEPGGEAEVVVTDQPQAWIGAAGLGDAELAALSSGMLDASFEEATGEPIPAWVLDISAEVRQQPDQLLFPLPQVNLPHPGETTSGPLVLTAWEHSSAAQMLGTWAANGVVVLFQGAPSGQRWEQMRRNEGLT